MAHDQERKEKGFGLEKKFQMKVPLAEFKNMFKCSYQNDYVTCLMVVKGTLYNQNTIQ
jgi:hypothetical protein